MISLNERNKLFNQYKPVADRAARGFAAMVRGSSYEFDDIQQDAYEIMLHFFAKKIDNIRHIEACVYRHIKFRLLEIVKSKKRGLITPYQKNIMGISHCSDSVLDFITDDRDKSDIDFQIDLDTIYTLLTEREKDILELCLSGYGLQEIGDIYGLSKQTIANIYDKIARKIKNTRQKSC